MMRRRHLASTTFPLLALLPVLCTCGPGATDTAATETGVAGKVESSAVEESEGRGIVGKQFAGLLAGIKPPRRYEMRSVSPNGEPSMTMIVKMGDQQPLKVKTMQEDGWMLVDLEKGETYAFEPTENMIMKLPVGAGAQPGSMNPNDFVDPDAETVGRDRVDGVNCWVIESKVGPMESKVWIGTEDGLPRQSETEEGITRFLYSRINEAPDSEFALPESVQIVDMAQMMQRGFKQAQ